MHTLSKQRSLFLFPACLLILLSLGCGTSEQTGTIDGIVLFKQRPVYPGKVLVKSSTGQSYSANLSEKGEFKLMQIQPGVYQVAVEPIRLGRAGAPSRNMPVADPNATDSLPNREEAIPEQFRAANINFPKKYRNLNESGLQIDCSNSFPEEPVKLELK